MKTLDRQAPAFGSENVACQHVFLSILVYAANLGQSLLARFNSEIALKSKMQYHSVLYHYLSEKETQISM